MSSQQRLTATLPASKQVLVEESFINGEELATKILPGIRQTEDADASNEASDTRKRRIDDDKGEKRLAGVKRLKERQFRDPLPTPWKASSFVEGPWKIMREERLVREEKYEISFDTFLRSINRIKDPMYSKGWDLKYTTVSNSDGLIVKVCVKVPSEFGHSFPHILEDLEEILATEIGMDLQDDTDK
ncbi:hypothetical protein B0J13DRAFT_614416 [Dactylonectria estremocensis]|uniref:Uncharacterized protein n=1 Tax=Dactylonectria estremocensis TaxID=1079267 RepID=A0A9P9CZM7_9HYPO|nr:hypothetical protein B0J13DRAFT_614416 [Dactylonectria estremocensis]